MQTDIAPEVTSTKGEKNFEKEMKMFNYVEKIYNSVKLTL